MKEIKFRAWDKNCSRMFNTVTELWFGNNDYFKELFFNQDFYFKAETKIDNGVEMHQATSEDCILMQYTGLKDKNGKEIYEGDIVRLASIFGKNVGDRSGYWTTKVEYNGCGFSPLCDQEIEQDEIEIIGNIYENKELTK